MEFTPEVIRQIRAKMGMTQQEFADYLGIGSATVVRWESGDFKPSAMAIPLLEKAARKAQVTE